MKKLGKIKRTNNETVEAYYLCSYCGGTCVCFCSNTPEQWMDNAEYEWADMTSLFYK